LAEKGARGRDWAEVARNLRELTACEDERCTWHTVGDPDTNTQTKTKTITEEIAA
jgi:hypothetical protein